MCASWLAVCKSTPSWKAACAKPTGRVRVTVQLVKASDGCQLWSEQYDRPLDNVFALQDEIVRKIVEKLAARLQGSPEDPLVKLATRNVQAYRLYLMGRHHCSHWTPEGLEPGIAQLREALNLDPVFAKAHAGLAAAYLLQGFWGLVPPPGGLAGGSPGCADSAATGRQPRGGACVPGSSAGDHPIRLGRVQPGNSTWRCAGVLEIRRFVPGSQPST